MRVVGPALPWIAGIAERCCDYVEVHARYKLCEGVRGPSCYILVQNLP